MKKICTGLLLAHSFFAWADTPIFTMVPQGALPTTVLPTGTAIAKYTVTNNTPYALQKIGLSYQPSGQTPVGVTQTTSGVNTPPTCGNKFTLGANSSCTLVLTITGANLVDGQAVGGPELCYTSTSPSRCSVPTAANQLNITLTTTVNTLSVVSGSDRTISEVPFLVQSNDGGTTWSVGVMPGDLPSGGFFSTAACSSGLCFAAGHDEDLSIPLIVQTNDSGTTWINKIPLPALTAKNMAPTGLLNTAGCNSSDCVTAGQASGSSIILYTLDDGATWTKVTTPGLTGSNIVWGQISCSTSLCIVAGDDFSGLSSLIAQSLTGSGVWTSADLSALSSSGLFSSACLGDFCIAGGATAPGNAPLLVQTNNAGSSWVEFDLSSALGGGYQGVLLAAGCASNICIVAGEEITGALAPLLIQSTNGGTSWDLADLSGTMYIGGQFNSASCSTSICVAAGATNSGAPMLVYSNNAGSSWAAQDFSITYSTATFNSVSCDGDFCIAAGQGNNGGPGEPFLVQTTDAGSSWSVITVPGVPSQGQFGGAVATQLKKVLNTVKGWF